MEGQQTDTGRASLERVERGREALTRGDWVAARDIFDAALEAQESAEALEGLARSCWWLDEASRVADARERAFQLYRERGDNVSAARVALDLAEDAMLFRGDEAVSNGWFQRARRLLGDVDPTVEHAVLATREALFSFMVAADMEAARTHASDAIRLAGQFGRFDLEMHARAIEGAALVALGSVAEGMRILDEATAAATSGEMQDVELIANTCCWMIYGCERARDFRRAAQWCHRLREFTERFGMPSLLGVCRTHYGGLLSYGGAWVEAEAELAAAARLLAVRPVQASEGIARLGELRRRQGRLGEAARLLEDVPHLPEAQVCSGWLALDRGEPAEAAQIAERLLRQLPKSDQLQRVHAQEILVRAYAHVGDLDAARVALAAVAAAASSVGTPPLRAAASMAAGTVALAAGDAEEATVQLDDAVVLYARSEMPYEAGEARVLLAQAWLALDQADRASAQLARAADAFERLGAVAAERRARAALPGPRRDRSDPVLTRREVEVLRLVADGASDRIVAERLTISEHTVHRHVANILRKLNVSSRTAAVAQATRRGLL